MLGIDQRSSNLAARLLRHRHDRTHDVDLDRPLTGIGIGGVHVYEDAVPLGAGVEHLLLAVNDDARAVVGEARLVAVAHHERVAVLAGEQPARRTDALLRWVVLLIATRAKGIFIVSAAARHGGIQLEIDRRGGDVRLNAAGTPADAGEVGGAGRRLGRHLLFGTLPIEPLDGRRHGGDGVILLVELRPEEEGVRAGGAAAQVNDRLPRRRASVVAGTTRAGRRRHFLADHPLLKGNPLPLVGDASRERVPTTGRSELAALVRRRILERHLVRKITHRNELATVGSSDGDGTFRSGATGPAGPAPYAIGVNAGDEDVGLALQ